MLLCFSTGKANVDFQKLRVLSAIVIPTRASLIAQLVKNLPAMQETTFRSLGWEDPLEKGKAIHSVFWPREFHELCIVHGVTESDMTEKL